MMVEQWAWKKVDTWDELREILWAVKRVAEMVSEMVAL
jgi:hypothetical protein